MKIRASDSLIQRLVVGGGALILFLALCFSAHSPFFGWVLAAVLSLLTAAALWEYYELVAGRGTRPYMRSGIWGTVLYVFASYASMSCPGAHPLPQLVLALLLIWVFGLQLRRGIQGAMLNLSETVFGFVYLVLPLSLLLTVTYCPSQDGRLWLLYIVLVTKVTDIAGFAVGKTLGRHAMAPRISPKKTWEGSIGGIVASIAMSLLIQQLAQSWVGVDRFTLGVGGAVVLGALVALLAQFGDLAESVLKRDAKVKDSSSLPGLGGVLDMVDSLVFTPLIVYFYLWMVVV